MRIVWAAPDRSVTPNLNSLVVEPHRTSWLRESRLFWTTDFGHSMTSSSCYLTSSNCLRSLLCFAVFGTTASQRWSFVAGGCVWASHPLYLLQPWRLQSSWGLVGKAPSRQPQNFQALEQKNGWISNFNQWFSTPLSYVHGISYTRIPSCQYHRIHR